MHNYIEYVVIDISSIKQENSTYRNSSLTCSITVGEKDFGFLSLARSSHALYLPLINQDDTVQFDVTPMTNPKNRIGKKF